MSNVLPLHSINSIESGEYTVTELSAKIKQSIESSCGYVRVRGEISGLKIATSGHAYFNLKDEGAVLAATCWRPVLAKMQAKLDEGMEVIAGGRITAYGGQSKYQISVDHIEPAGAGALMQILAKRKALLQAEGLFESNRKKPLPFFPRIIGVVTSLTGAVIKDIVHRISDRCSARIIIWPVTVQGDKAAGEIASAIDGFQSHNLKPDVIIVARGGGSIEDLWAFNEEVVVRAVARCNIPIISAIGHETDFTLTDFAADVRAPTPTAAAEFATPVIAELQTTLMMHSNSLTNTIKSKITRGNEILRAYDGVLASPRAFIMRYEQRLDDLQLTFQSMLPKLLITREMQLKQYRIDFLDPSKIMMFKETQLYDSSKSLSRASINTLQNIEPKLTVQSELLRSLDYKNVLKRGYAIVHSEGSILCAKDNATSGDKINIELKDGIINAIIE